MNQESIVICGAGPAGLTAAYELIRRGIYPIIFEKADKVGGLSRTEVFNGYRIDIGGHRFFTKNQHILKLWLDILGDEFLEVKRLSRIYYQGRYFPYPLQLFRTLMNIGIGESLAVVTSYLKSKLFPYPKEITLEQWISNRFGYKLYQIFFESFTKKIWGISGSEMQSDWAAQRINGLSVSSLLSHAIRPKKQIKSLIRSFYYPELGPGMMWEQFQNQIEEQGGKVNLNHEVLSLKYDDNRIISAEVKCNGKTQCIRGSHFISTMSLSDLIDRLDPVPPDEVVRAANGLKYRDFVIVTLIVKHHSLFPDNWLYIHSSDVHVGRIQNFKNWSPAMVPDPETVSLGMEYFCTKGDHFWNLDDTELIDLASRELDYLKLAQGAAIKKGFVIRQPKAYPIYDSDYKMHLSVIRRFLDKIVNLYSIGRNGMHRYNNQDHSMLTGLLAVENILGRNHDVWSVNENQEYHEK